MKRMWLFVVALLFTLPALAEEPVVHVDGLQIDPDDLDTLLGIDVDRWRQEMTFREQHLAQFANLPEEIWAAHRRVTQALDA